MISNLEAFVLQQMYDTHYKNGENVHLNQGSQSNLLTACSKAKEITINDIIDQIKTSILCLAPF